MMEVPSWLVILLSVLSFTIVLLFALFLATVVRNYLRRRRYEQIQGQYVPGKLIAHFKGNVQAKVIPKTFPAFKQSGSTASSPASLKVVPYKGGASNTSSAYQSFGAAYRKSQTDGSNFRSPPHGTCIDPNSRVINKIQHHDFSNTSNDECDPVYSHSDFFMDMDRSLHEDDNPVFSYDQRSYHQDTTKTVGPASLFFQLEYNSQIPELLVVIKSAIDLPPLTSDESNTLNSYVNFCLVPEDFLWQRTSVIIKNNNPVYNETFRIRDVLYHKLREYTLCFFVMDCTSHSRERVVGRVLYPLSDMRAEDRVEVCKELSPL